MSSPKQEASPFDLAAGVPQLAGELRPQPRLADRISRRVLGILGCLVGVVLLIFMAALDAIDRRQEKKPAEEVLSMPAAKAVLQAEAAPPSELLGTKASGGPSLPASAAQQEPVPLERPASPPTGTVPALNQRGAPGVVDAIPVEDPHSVGIGDPGVARNPPRKTPEELAQEREREERLQRMQQARKQGLAVSAFKPSEEVDVPPGGNASVAANAAINKLLAAANDPAAAARSGQAVADRSGDSEQQQKQNFLRNAANDYKTYHPHVPVPARSENELKGGSFIRMSLQYAINSDLPGEVLARVTEDVYDTVTGCRLLIPGMSTARGKYDSKVALGQGRNLVAWTSMVFPDGSELNLGGAQGYDTSGAAGLEADVDNHYLRLFGLTFGMSLITAEVQMSAPPPTNSPNGGMSAQQSLAMALSQQYGQLGAQILGKYMAVQPTLRNSPGERFVVMVPATIVFTKVWRRRC